jgi:hypothetical protein
MLDFEFDELYVGKDGVEKAVYGDEESYQTVMDHSGSLGFSFRENVEHELGIDAPGSRKIEEMIAEFVAEVGDVEDRESFVENFDLRQFYNGGNNVSGTKSQVIRTDGGEQVMNERTKTKRGLGRTLDLIDERVGDFKRGAGTARGEEIGAAGRCLSSEARRLLDRHP